MVFNEQKIIKNPDRYIGRRIYVGVEDLKNIDSPIILSSPGYISDIVVVDSTIHSFWVVRSDDKIVRQRNFINSFITTNYKQLIEWQKRMYKEAYEYFIKFSNDLLKKHKSISENNIKNTLNSYITKEYHLYYRVKENKKKYKTA